MLSIADNFHVFFVSLCIFLGVATPARRNYIFPTMLPSLRQRYLMLLFHRNVIPVAIKTRVIVFFQNLSPLYCRKMSCAFMSCTSILFAIFNCIRVYLSNYFSLFINVFFIILVPLFARFFSIFNSLWCRVSNPFAFPIGISKSCPALLFFVRSCPFLFRSICLTFIYYGYATRAYILSGIGSIVSIADFTINFFAFISLVVVTTSTKVFSKKRSFSITSFANYNSFSSSHINLRQTMTTIYSIPQE